MGFGQHQSFYLRPQWLFKSLIEVDKDSRFFYSEDHFEVLGIGKNMAKSARHWMVATKVVEDVRIKGKTEQVVTKFGQILNKFDPFIQQKYTKGLLHYYLVTDRELATAWYWFFNEFNETVFDKQSTLTELEVWVKDTLNKTVSVNSLRRDIDCLFATYIKKNDFAATPEEVIRSPFEELSLISETLSKNYVKSTVINDLDIDLLFTCLKIYMDKFNVTEVSLDELVRAPELWGRVFNMTRSEVVESVESITKVFPVVFTRTNQLDIVRITENLVLEDIKKEIYKRRG